MSGFISFARASAFALFVACPRIEPAFAYSAKSRGLPKGGPLALRAARAALVRAEMVSRSCATKAHHVGLGNEPMVGS